MSETWPRNKEFYEAFWPYLIQWIMAISGSIKTLSSELERLREAAIESGFTPPSSRE